MLEQQPATVAQAGGGRRHDAAQIVEAVGARHQRRCRLVRQRRDPLRRLGRAFDAAIDRETRRAKRNGTMLSLLMIDIDHFKRFNDTWGHLAGDAVLWAVASVLRHGVRDSDVVARLGGDEFAVILSGCTPRRAARIGGELLHTLAALSIPWDQDRLRIGASIGIAPLAGGMSVDQAVAAADAQCYRAKAMGRNNVQVQGELSQLPGDDPDAAED